MLAVNNPSVKQTQLKAGESIHVASVGRGVFPNSGESPGIARFGVHICTGS